jgi:hypothetical protein
MLTETKNIIQPFILYDKNMFTIKLYRLEVVRGMGPMKGWFNRHKGKMDDE